MIRTPLTLCGNMKNLNALVVAASNNHIPVLFSKLAHQRREYAKKTPESSCCKAVAQTAGRNVEPWPKPDPDPNCDCPPCPCQPPNYDPYKIKVPEVAVPPLPVSNVKELPTEDCTGPLNFATPKPQVRDLFMNSAIVHPDYWRNKPGKKLSDGVTEPLPKLGYHGKSKYMMAFHEPWKPLDRLALLAEAEKQENTETTEDPQVERSN